MCVDWNYFVTISVFLYVQSSLSQYPRMSIHQCRYSSPGTRLPSTDVPRHQPLWPTDRPLSESYRTSPRRPRTDRILRQELPPRHSRTCWVCRDSNRSYSPFVRIATDWLMSQSRTSSTESCNARGCSLRQFRLVADSERWPASEAVTTRYISNEWRHWTPASLATTSLVHCSLYARLSAVSIIFIASTKWLQLQSTWIYP